MLFSAPKTKNLYELLGLTKGSSADEIKKAYRRLALIYHPNRDLENDPAKTDKVIAMNRPHSTSTLVHGDQPRAHHPIEQAEAPDLRHVRDDGPEDDGADRRGEDDPHCPAVGEGE